MGKSMAGIHKFFHVLPSLCKRDTAQPDVEYLHWNITVLANSSMAKLRMSPRGALHVGQKVSFGQQLEQTRCPL
jgi:hypothetical protein